MTLSLSDSWFCLLEPLVKGSSFYSEVPLGVLDLSPSWHDWQLHPSGKKLLACYRALVKTEHLTHRGLGLSGIPVLIWSTRTQQLTNTPYCQKKKKKNEASLIIVALCLYIGKIYPSLHHLKQSHWLWGALSLQGFSGGVHWGCWGCSTSLPATQNWNKVALLCGQNTKPLSELWPVLPLMNHIIFFLTLGLLSMA